MANQTSKPNVTRSNATGVAGGTLTVLVANLLPTESAWRPILFYAAPTITILLRHFTDVIVEEWRALLKNWRFKRAHAATVKDINAAMQASDLSIEQKENYKKSLDEANRLAINSHLANLYKIAEMPPPTGQQKNPKRQRIAPRDDNKGNENKE